MNGKESSIETGTPPITNAKVHESMKMYVNKVSISCKSGILGVWELCKEDSNRVIFSLKVGLAVLLVSLLILCRMPYQVFGTNIIWSILTVAIMFEYTVGATFNRGFNRALGSVLAALMAIGVAQVALSAGRIAEPIVIGFSIFLVGAVTSFMKLWPSLVPYEYGFRVILFTYCLIIVSGYRMGSPIRTAMDRLYSILLGAVVALVVNVFILPIWAGEQLHKELVSNFSSVADALEECVGKYLEDERMGDPEFTHRVMDDFPDEPAYRRCQSALNSSAKLQNLANSAKWEPPHGRFRNFFYPWTEYVKVGAVLRYCAYEVMALHGVLHSEIQAPYNLRITFQKEIQDAATEATAVVRCLGKDICNMKRSLNICVLRGVHSSTERLQRAIDMHSYILTSTHEPQQSKLQNKNPNNPSQHSESYHVMMEKQSRRLYSWPSREVEAFEEEGGFSSDGFPRVRAALDSTNTLSLTAFTSLLIEFVARLEHLVEAVDELSKMAKFEQEAL